MQFLRVPGPPNDDCFNFQARPATISIVPTAITYAENVTTLTAFVFFFFKYRTGRRARFGRSFIRIVESVLIYGARFGLGCVRICRSKVKSESRK